MKSIPSTSRPPIESRQLRMALDAPTLHELSCLELTAVLVALAGLLLEAASTAPRENDDERA